jgi:hypothetical protein
MSHAPRRKCLRPAGLRRRLVARAAHNHPLDGPAVFWASPCAARSWGNRPDAAIGSCRRADSEIFPWAAELRRGRRLTAARLDRRARDAARIPRSQLASAGEGDDRRPHTHQVKRSEQSYSTKRSRCTEKDHPQITQISADSGRRIFGNLRKSAPSADRILNLMPMGGDDRRPIACRAAIVAPAVSNRDRNPFAGPQGTRLRRARRNYFMSQARSHCVALGLRPKSPRRCFSMSGMWPPP